MSELPAASEQPAASEPFYDVAWPHGVDVQTSDAAGTVCVDVPVDRWLDCVAAAQEAGYDYLDWLSAVDEFDRDPGGLDVVAHLAALSPLRRVLVRTRVPSGDLHLASVTALFPGAAWHERETFEMFGVEFDGFVDPSENGLRPLLLPDGFEGTPLRKTFQLAARAAKPWPGAKEPGEGHGDAGAPSRRKALPPGVPDPTTWGPRDS